MEIHGNFQNLEMCGIYQWSYPSWCRAPKQGILGRTVSIGACLRVWKHGMHCNNENWLGNYFFYLPYRGAPDNSEAHQCVMFNGTGVIYSMHVFFIIKYGSDFEH
jgi:hypothetical protein